MAALPLVVEGLRLYVKGIDTIKRWWKYAKVLKHLIRKLEMEKAKSRIRMDFVGERKAFRPVYRGGSDRPSTYFGSGLGLVKYC